MKGFVKCFEVSVELMQRVGLESWHQMTPYADSVEGVGVGVEAALSTWLLKGVFPWGYREVQCGLETSFYSSTSHPGCGSSSRVQ